MYKYKAKVTGVYDGDSITCDIDLGFNMTIHKAKIRLEGIDTPELRSSPEAEKAMAIEARDYLRSIILNKEIILETTKKDKYGRYLGLVYFKNVLINQQMIREGYAVEYISKK